MRAIIFDKQPVVVEKTVPPLRRDSVLLRVVKAWSGGLENYILQGYTRPNHGIVMGFEGLGKIIEVGVDIERNIIGMYAYLSSTRKGIPGYDRDGFFAEYTALSYDQLSLLKLPRGPSSYSLAYPSSIGIGYTAYKMLREHYDKRLLIIGGGPAALTTILLLHRDNIDFSIISERLCRKNNTVREAWIRTLCRREIRDAQVVFVSSLGQYDIDLSSKALLLLHPLSTIRIVRLGRKLRNIKLRVLDKWSLPRDLVLLHRLSKKISGLLGLACLDFTSVNSLEEGWYEYSFH